MKKEVIKCDKNYYKISCIEIGAINNNCYLKFHFSKQDYIRKFRTYLQTALIMLTNDANEPIQFKELSCAAEDSLNAAVIVGNIKQAIDYFKIDGLFPTNVNTVLDDKEEDGVQQILKESEKSRAFLSTVPVSKYINHDFFLTKESEKSRSSKLVNKLNQSGSNCVIL